MCISIKIHNLIKTPQIIKLVFLTFSFIKTLKRSILAIHFGIKMKFSSLFIVIFIVSCFLIELKAEKQEKSFEENDEEEENENENSDEPIDSDFKGELPNIENHQKQDMEQDHKKNFDDGRGENQESIKTSGHNPKDGGEKKHETGNSDKIGKNSKEGHVQGKINQKNSNFPSKNFDIDPMRNKKSQVTQARTRKIKNQIQQNKQKMTKVKAEQKIAKSNHQRKISTKINQKDAIKTKKNKPNKILTNQMSKTMPKTASYSKFQSIQEKRKPSSGQRAYTNKNHMIKPNALQMQMNQASIMQKHSYNQKNPNMQRNTAQNRYQPQFLQQRRG